MGRLSNLSRSFFKKQMIKQQNKKVVEKTASEVNDMMSKMKTNKDLLPLFDKLILDSADKIMTPIFDEAVLLSKVLMTDGMRKTLNIIGIKIEEVVSTIAGKGYTLVPIFASDSINNFRVLSDDDIKSMASDIEGYNKYIESINKGDVETMANTGFENFSLIDENKNYIGALVQEEAELLALRYHLSNPQLLCSKISKVFVPDHGLMFILEPMAKGHEDQKLSLMSTDEFKLLIQSLKDELPAANQEVESL